MERQRKTHRGTPDIGRMGGGRRDTDTWIQRTLLLFSEGLRSHTTGCTKSNANVGHVG